LLLHLDAFSMHEHSLWPNTSAQAAGVGDPAREQCVLLAQNMIKSNKNFTWSCWLLGFEKKKFLSSSLALPRSGFKSIHPSIRPSNMGCCSFSSPSVFDMPRDFCSLINGHSLCNCIISGSVPISHLLCAGGSPYIIHTHTACGYIRLLCFYCSAISCCTSA
jgi:hypothetical protein